MKIISVFVFAAALIGTWWLANAKKSIADSVHYGIQSDLKRAISEYVVSQLPNVKNFRFEKFWTQTLDKNKVKAFFVYSFEDRTEEGEPTILEIEGTALLNKIEETAESSTWSFDEIQISGSKVNFTEPIQITSRPGELENSH